MHLLPVTLPNRCYSLSEWVQSLFSLCLCKLRQLGAQKSRFFFFFFPSSRLFWLIVSRGVKNGAPLATRNTNLSRCAPTRNRGFRHAFALLLWLLYVPGDDEQNETEQCMYTFCCFFVARFPPRTGRKHVRAVGEEERVALSHFVLWLFEFLMGMGCGRFYQFFGLL